MFEFLNKFTVEKADGLFFVKDKKQNKFVELFGVPAYSDEKQAKELCDLLNEVHNAGADSMR